MKKYYNLELKKTVSVTGLKTVENLTLDKAFFYPSETHKFYELIYVLDGNIYCENDEKIVSLNVEEFKLTLPNVSHRYFTDTKARIFIICFSCNTNVLSALDQSTLLEMEEKILMEKLIIETEKAFELPFKERVILKKDAPIGAQQIIENIIEELLIKLLRKQLANDKIYAVKDISELQLNLVNDVIELLKNNIYSKISLSEICKKLFYSNTYLNNLFKKYKHITIIKYYHKLKIEEAKSLLNQGFTVAEISDKLCFDNPNYFGKSFRAITGNTPSEYKKLTTDMHKIY